MLDHHVVVLLVVLDADLVQEDVGRLADHHGGEELPAEPRSAAGADGLLDDGDADGGVLRKLVGAGKAGGACADDDDVCVGVGDHVGHVAAGHLAGDDGFLDGFEAEGAEVVGRGDGEVLVVGGGSDGWDARWEGVAMEGGLVEG